MNAQNYHYADRKFSVGEIYDTIRGNEEIIAIWLDRKYGDVIRTKEGGDHVPGDFYRKVICKIR